MNIASLWSGGIDSTIATYFFAYGYIIQPYHVLIRNGGGKDAREREAIDLIFDTLKEQFPNVLPVIRVKHKISPSDHRNEDLINFVKNEFSIKKVILGTHKVIRDISQERINDSNWEYLQKKTGIDVFDLNKLGHSLKKDQFQIGINLLGIDVLKMTWSCQLWWKNPCKNCFSCKERKELFEKYDKKRL